jgi:tRNA pseudouridine55 synthase
MKVFPSSGFLFVSKPSGITSSQLVQKIKRKLNLQKVGHTGTLDKAAEGLMILPFNKYTCFADKILGKDKVYDVKIKTGISTDSGDLEGNILESWDIKKIDEFYLENSNTIREKIESIVNWKTQVPPQISALKKNGRRYSDLFRENKSFEIKERTIKIFQVSIQSLSKDEFHIQIGVSSGTYIRKIVQDLGDALQIPLVVSYLKRISIGVFPIEEAESLEDILDGKLPLVSSLEKVYPLPRIEVDEFQVRKIQNGNAIPMDVPKGEFLFANNGILLAWCVSNENSIYKYLKVF